MPLYSNILLSSQDNEARGSGNSQERLVPRQAPSASLKLLQDHLKSKKRVKQTHFQPNKLLKASDKSQILLEDHLHQRSEFDRNLGDEYDPMTPNSYEILQLEHIKAEEQRVAARRSGNRIDLSILDALDRFDENDNTPDATSRLTRGTAIAPPPTLHSISKDSTTNSPEHAKVFVQTNETPTDKFDGRSPAAKIMAKMGYKSGQGLGKDKQGMNVPLEVEKSGAGLGRIVQKPRTPPPPVDEELDATRILLLRNMVGSGEVDDDLEAETKEECTKYGEVVKCLIYEIPDKQVPDDEAVRIFVEFKSVASTKKAISDLNGRYFGGRVVKATSYDENKFSRYELAP